MARNKPKATKKEEITVTPKVEVIVDKKVLKPVKIKTGGKFKILNTGCIYLDPETKKSYMGEDVFKAEEFTRYEKRNMAKTKQEAITFGKAFYLVEE